MWTTRSSFAILLLTASAAVAQSTKLVGVELQVNTYTPGRQASPVVDRDSDGDFVVVWESSDQDGDGYGVFAQRFSSAGVRQGAELLVNSLTEGTQHRPAVGVDADGDFVVAWLGYVVDSYAILAQRFNSAGVPQGTEFQVSTATGIQVNYPDITLEGNGDFVVVWSAAPGPDVDIFARRFSSAGAAVGDELVVNAYTAGQQVRPRVGVDAEGDFAVVWMSAGQDGDEFGVFGRRFASTGGALAVEFQVNDATVKRQGFANISVNGSGAFVVAWVPYTVFDDGMMQVDTPAGIAAKRFGSTGAALGPELQVKQLPGANLLFPDVALRESGDFLVVWQESPLEFNQIAARHFDATGFPRGADFVLNAYSGSGQERASIAVDNDGEFVVAWDGFLRDGDFIGVFAQRLVTLADLDVDGNGSTDALTDGLLTLRYHFGFTGATLVNGVVGAGCSRCTPEAIFAYLQSKD